MKNFKKEFKKTGFQGQIQEHQNIGIYWLERLYKKKINGAILADDMGMGKTFQTIGFLSLIKTKRIVILAPASVVENWKKEFQKFNPKLLEKVIVTSYESFRTKIKLNQDDILILDESQKLKNKKTIVSTILINTKVRFTLFLSGTPIENKIDYIFTLLLILYPKLEPVLRRLKRIKDIDATITIFRKMIDGVFLARKMSKNILETKLIEAKIDIKASKVEKETYNKIKKFFSKKLNSIKNNSEFYREAIVGLMRMNQLISNVKNLSQDFLDDLKISKSKREFEPSKMEELEKIVEKILNQGEKVVIFTLFRKTMMEILEKYPNAIYIDGGVSKKERGKIIDEFQKNENRKIIVISLMAGATGITLTSANHTIFYDLWWNPAVMDQAVRRTYRIGQKKDCYIYYLVSELELDKLIYETNVFKRELRKKFDESGKKVKQDEKENEADLIGKMFR